MDREYRLGNSMSFFITVCCSLWMCGSFYIIGLHKLIRSSTIMRCRFVGVGVDLEEVCHYEDGLCLIFTQCDTESTSNCLLAKM